MNVNAILSKRIVRHVFAACCLGLALSVLAVTGLVAINPTQTGASSHREAPLISKDPTVDNLDVYAFVSPDLTGTVTFIATWIPFEEPGGGPNFYHFDPNARYKINIDQDGNAIPDIIYQWTFEKPTPLNPATFLYNVNQITSIDDPDYNLRQYYTVTKITGDTLADSTTVIVPRSLMPPDNIGPRSIPDYKGDIEGDPLFVKSCGPGCQEFTGQRDDPFYVDVGSIFDLGGLRPFNGAHIITRPTETGLDVLKGYNMHATAIQVRIADLVPAGCVMDHTGGNQACVIGVWSTAERCSPTVLTAGSKNCSPGSTFVQVSRLGNPLVNEAVIDLERKDAFNGVPPTVDATLPDVVARVTNPELAGLINFLYPATTDISTTNRNDLVTVFLTGIPPIVPIFTTQQVNSGLGVGQTASEQLRLNVAVKPTQPACAGDRLGLMNDDSVATVDGDDLTAFPNGRRLEDDVTDMALRAVAQGYGGFIAGAYGGAVPEFRNLAVNNTLGDGVDNNDQPFPASCLSSFPYMPTPFSGYENNH